MIRLSSAHFQPGQTPGGSTARTASAGSETVETSSRNRNMAAAPGRGLTCREDVPSSTTHHGARAVAAPRESGLSAVVSCRAPPGTRACAARRAWLIDESELIRQLPCHPPRKRSIRSAHAARRRDRVPQKMTPHGITTGRRSGRARQDRQGRAGSHGAHGTRNRPAPEAVRTQTAAPTTCTTARSTCHSRVR